MQTEKNLSPWRRRLGILMTALFGLILLVVISLAWQVEDWGRDLKVNRAQSIEEADDVALRPMNLDGNVAQTVDLVQTVASKLPRWRWIETREVEQAGAELHFTRTTALFRFVDDIYVTISPDATGSRITLVSQSRVGKGDLGQNPRNIRELISALMASQKAAQSS
jgi:uncharacterized protein (DUF1499 family)